MQKTAVATAEIVCCAVQENDQLTSAAFLLTAYFVHLKIEAYLQAII